MYDKQRKKQKKGDKTACGKNARIKVKIVRKRGKSADSAGLFGFQKTHLVKVLAHFTVCHRGCLFVFFVA
jgi:hypothetical protein